MDFLHQCDDVHLLLFHLQARGFLGLLLGASVLTMIELIDFVILRCLHRMANVKKAEEKSSESLLRI